MLMKNSSDTIENRACDLPACSAVQQPTALPHAPVWLFMTIGILFFKNKINKF
jgi:hypothetical protein